MRSLRGRRVLLLLALLMAAGCAGERRSASLPAAPPEPWMPEPISLAALPACEGPTAGRGQNVPVDMVVFYVGGASDFNDEAGPDGYVLRVAFLDRNYQATMIERGMLRVCLAAQTQERPQAQWDIEAKDLADMWIPSRLLDGYMLRLSRGTTLPVSGDFVFYVYYYPDGADAPPAYCRRVYGQDYQ